MDVCCVTSLKSDLLSAGFVLFYTYDYFSVITLSQICMERNVLLIFLKFLINELICFYIGY
jgi:hypothetical protein